MDRKEEGLNDISRLFRAIAKVEVEHETEYLALRAVLEAEGFLTTKTMKNGSVKCAVTCIVENNRQKACPLCKVEQGYFKKRCENITAG